MNEENIAMIISYVNRLAGQKVKICPQTLVDHLCPMSRSRLYDYMNYMVQAGQLQRVMPRGGYLPVNKHRN